MSTTTDPDLDEDMGLSGDERFLEEARRRRRISEELTRDQRDREEEDLSYQVPENQWDPAAKAARAGGVGSPARPIVSVSGIDQPQRLVMAGARAAKLGVSIHPVSVDADEDAASVREGLYSRIQRDSNANQARLFALDRAVKAGIGWYRVDVKYDEDGFEEGDLEIIIKRILYQSSVYYDPAAVEPDLSDGEYLFFSEWMPLETFKRRYPKSRAAEEEDTSREWFEGLDNDAPGWVRQDGDAKAVQVCEYFYKEHEYKTINKGTPRERTRDVVTVHWALITGHEVLKRQEWMGKYIPFVPVFGRELQPFRGERRIEGMTRPARDACKFKNQMLSNYVERGASEPRNPYMMAAGQDEGFEEEWQTANIENRVALHYNAKVDGVEGVLPPPQRMQLNPTGTSMAQQGVMLGKELIQEATATYDPGLGKASHQQESGRKVLALQSQGDAATSEFLDNAANISMRYEALVVLDLMAPVYDRSGRVVTILGGEDQKPQKVMLGKAFTMDKATGRPVAAAPGAKGAKQYDLSKGRYAIAPIVGKSNQTRLQDAGEQVGRLIEAEPALVQTIGDIYVRNLDIPGGKEIADRLKRLIEQTHPGLLDEGDGGGAEQLQAKAKAMEAQLQQMSQQLQQAVQAIQTKQVEAQAGLQKAQMDAAAKIELQRMQQEHAIVLQQMKDAAAITVAQINAQVKGLQLATEARNEALALHEQQAHEVGLTAMEHAHAQEQAQMAAEQQAQAQSADQSHEAGMQEQAQGHDAAQADADRQAAAEQAQAAAEAQAAAQSGAGGVV